MRIGYYLLFYAFSCGGGKGNLERETDVDRDGYAAEEDCDDANNVTGADEYCDDIDNDCDTFIDEPGAIGSVQWFPMRMVTLTAQLARALVMCSLMGT